MSSKVFDRDHVHRGSVTALNFAQGLSLKRASINAGPCRIPTHTHRIGGAVDDADIDRNRWSASLRLRRHPETVSSVASQLQFRENLRKGRSRGRPSTRRRPPSGPRPRRPSGPADAGGRDAERRRPRLNYFGQQAKREFFDLYKSMARQAEIVDDVGARVAGEERARLAAWSDDDGDVDDEASKSGSSCASSKIPAPEAATGVSDPSHSPRHRFARGIAAMMKRLRRPGATGGDPFCLPEPLFVRRAASDGLDLAHRAYGDDLAILLADMITELPALRRLNNVLDGAAIDSLARFLETEACALEELHLDGADADDGEIRDLARGREERHFENPRALGAQSGSLIGGALMKNRSLAWFSLAFNCIGDAGAMALGRALDANGTIQHLDVSSNGIRNRGAQVIAEGLRDNLRLTRLDMSGNPVGALGGRALLASLNYARRPRHIELGGCELSGDDRAPGRFNPATPQGHYDLDLDDPFQWMVAKQLIWLSVTRAGAKFRSLVEIDASSGGKPTKRSVTLVSRTPEADKPGAIGWEPGKKVEGPKAPISREVSAKIRNRIRASLVGESVESIVDKFDDDNSGTLDASELTELMRRVFRIAPAEVSDADIRKLLDALDEDASGTISTAEFAEFVDKGDAAFFVKSPKKAKPAGFHAIARLRGFFGRVDAVQKFEAGVTDARTSSVARALIVADYAGVRESAAGGTAANLLKVTRALRTRIASKASVEHARFKMKSVMAATTSRQVRLSIARLEPLDSETGRPYKLPTGPKARLQCHLTAATMPPSELSVQNATGIAAMERLILSPQVGDRIALVRLAAVDLRIFAMQLQHFLDRLMQSARPLDGGEIVDFFVCLLPLPSTPTPWRASCSGT
ncbi:hypothetical protein JL720_8297 [Aureococcus anophagefferens]|nr:hypothetical protein JL720_8297 [Aureococcus anophagefferens]